MAHSLLPVIQPNLEILWGLRKYYHCLLVVVSCSGGDYLFADTRVFLDLLIPFADGLSRLTGTLKVMCSNRGSNLALEFLDVIFLI